MHLEEYGCAVNESIVVGASGYSVIGSFDLDAAGRFKSSRLGMVSVTQHNNSFTFALSCINTHTHHHT